MPGLEDYPPFYELNVRRSTSVQESFLFYLSEALDSQHHCIMLSQKRDVFLAYPFPMKSFLLRDKPAWISVSDQWLSLAHEA